VDDLHLDPGGELRAVARADLLGGIVAVEAAAMHRPAAAGDWPYTAPSQTPYDGEAVTLSAIPYATWGNRGDGAMRVWLPVTPGDAAGATATRR
jgi:DUF1680 family protein